MITLPSIDTSQIATFQKTVWDYYRANRRDMSWRREPTPYHVLVSELMLQQTQVARVRLKFTTFIRAFPTVQSLAAATLADVIKVWSGLGYNRRAKFLWEAAKKIVTEYEGQVPQSQSGLLGLPGVGLNTAGAIMAYAFNEPAVFIETNIRTVYIHHFFDDHPDAVSDDDLRHVISLSLPLDNPRDWYWALMDYGTHLKATIGSQLHRVKNYKPQSRFEGSKRQVRGAVLKLLVEHRVLTMVELASFVVDERLSAVCDALIAEGLVIRNGDQLRLTDA